MFWNTRDTSILILDNELPEAKKCLKTCFSLKDKCIERFENITDDDPTFPKIFGLTLVKARRFGHALYSLTLDGLAQEGGCVLRNLIESIELMIYFEQDPSRVNEVIEDTLPNAGRIAQTIEGKFQNVREHLNEHASHFSFSRHSIMHLIDWKTHSFKIDQTVPKEILKHNFFVLNAVLNISCATSIRVLENSGYYTQSIKDEYIHYHKEFSEYYNHQSKN